MQKKHRTAENSISSYIEIVASGQIAKEKLIVLSALSIHQPCTSRMLAKITSIERTSITRSLNGLVNESNLIIEAYSAPCPITGRKVCYYTLKDFDTSGCKKYQQQIKLFN